MVFWLVIWDSTCTSSNAQEQSQRDQGRRGGGVVVVAVVAAVLGYNKLHLMQRLTYDGQDVGCQYLVRQLQ